MFVPIASPPSWERFKFPDAGTYTYAHSDGDVARLVATEQNGVPSGFYNGVEINSQSRLGRMNWFRFGDYVRHLGRGLFG